MCCGRSSVLYPKRPRRPVAPRSAEPRRPARRTTVRFRYTGDKALTVIGAMTGRRYRFGGPGAVVPVDVRDRGSLRKIPKLRQLPGG